MKKIKMPEIIEFTLVATFTGEEPPFVKPIEEYLEEKITEWAQSKWIKDRVSPESTDYVLRVKLWGTKDKVDKRFNFIASFITKNADERCMSVKIKKEKINED